MSAIERDRLLYKTSEAHWTDRIRERQPKYDALVDAVRSPHSFRWMLWEDELKELKAWAVHISEALAALDREEP